MHRFSARKIIHHYFKGKIKKPGILPLLAGVFFIFFCVGWAIGIIINTQKINYIQKQEKKIKQEETALMNKLINKVKNKTYL